MSKERIPWTERDFKQTELNELAFRRALEFLSHHVINGWNEEEHKQERVVRILTPDMAMVYIAEIAKGIIEQDEQDEQDEQAASEEEMLKGE